MWKEIVAAIIGAVVGAILTPIVQVEYENYASAKLRTQLQIADIVATEWDAKWIDKNGKPLPPDTVTFAKWTKNNMFEGFGKIAYPNKLYNYTFRGEVTQGRIVVLTYKAERYPTESYIGTATLKLLPNALDMDGTWVGFEGDQPVGGKVTMHRVR